MRSWYDDLGRLCNSNAYATVRRTYCEQHRKLLDDRSRDNRNQHYYEFSENESLVNSLESSTASDCRFERRQQLQLESPTTTSCLKSVTDVKKKENKKRVNFVCEREEEEEGEEEGEEEEEEEEEEATHNTYASSSISSSQQSSRNATAIARRHNHYVKQVASTMPDIMQSSTSAMEELSLSSSCTANDNNNPPRIVKPRDVLRRPATRKMMIYPPEGQRGEPLTLNKKWSKIQCRVNGDVETGFRYKVYYLQTFESDKWFPNSKTNSPFYHLANDDDDDDDDDDNSTDYGN